MNLVPYNIMALLLWALQKGCKNKGINQCSYTSCKFSILKKLCLLISIHCIDSISELVVFCLFVCHIILPSRHCAAHHGYLGSWGNRAVMHWLIGAQGKHKH